MKNHILSLLVILSLTSCAVGPNYNNPNLGDLIIENSFHGKLPHDGKLENLSKWWEKFNDPALTELIKVAEKNSPTIDVALSRIDQARAVSGKATSEILPNISADSNISRSGSHSNLVSSTKTTSSASLDASWEIDLFGGRRRAVEQANAQLDSSIAAWHNARVTLASEVANSYFDYQACEANLKIATNRYNSQQETSKLVKYKVTTGLAAESDFDLSIAALASTKNSLEAQKGDCAQKFNSIILLTAISSVELNNILEKSKTNLALPDKISITALPADLLSQRPDIIQAERSLAASSAAIGIAEAELYPSLGLSGMIGINKSSSTPTVSLWSFGPAITLPIFNAGKLRSERDRTIAAYNETKANYKQTVLRAVNEVENALARLNAVTSRIKDAETSATKYRSFFKSKEIEFKSGTTSLLELEDTRRTVYSAESEYIGAKLEYIKSWIATYKAFGGGWDNQIKAEDKNGKK